MVILGIDPGTRRVGYGAVKKTSSDKIEFIDAGLIAIKSSNDFGALKEMKQGLAGLLDKLRPDVLTIEKLYFAKNQKTGIQVAQARGALILTALDRHIKVEEYSPNELKSGITGYGLADKKAVLKMVRLTLGVPNLKVIDDASDALALAIMGCK